MSHTIDWVEIRLHLMQRNTSLHVVWLLRLLEVPWGELSSHGVKLGNHLLLLLLVLRLEASGVVVKVLLVLLLSNRSSSHWCGLKLKNDV